MMSENANTGHENSSDRGLFPKLDAIIHRMAPGSEKTANAMTTGELAELRRMHPIHDTVRPPIFWQLLCEYGILNDRKTKLTDEEVQNWALIFQGMAMTAENCRDAKDDFGKALGKISENGDSLTKRFDLLMRAPRERFPDLLRHLLKLAVSRGCAFSWHELVRLITATDEDKSAESRRRLCASFYLAQYKNSDSQDQTEENEKETDD